MEKELSLFFARGMALVSSFIRMDGSYAMSLIGMYEFNGEKRLERRVGGSDIRCQNSGQPASRASQEKKGREKKKTHVTASNGCCVHAAARALLLLLLLLTPCRSRRRRGDSRANAERVC